MFIESPEIAPQRRKGRTVNVDHDNQLTGVVIGAAIAVHRQLGPGVDEMAYETALSARLTAEGISHQCQVSRPLTYKGVSLDCGFRLDILVEGRLPLELKAVVVVLPIPDAQLLTYMRLGAYPLGRLINFEVAVLKDGVRRKVQTTGAAPSQCSGQIPADFDELSRKILSGAVEVHRHLGPGLLRSSYEECLCHELSQSRTPFTRQHQVPLFCDGQPLGQSTGISLLVDNCVPVQCLSVAELNALHEARLLARIRQGNWPYGLLLNFNAPTLTRGFRRLTR
jgi:GxxExxY protein